ncbi:MAG: ATP-binding cassette domain-containing protein, partial [Blautia massiliensis (ex Durand et al. 2017)]
MMKRAKVLENRQQRAIEEKSGLLKNLEIVEDLKIFPQPYFARTLATLTDVAPVYDGRAVCAPVRFTVEQGDRIALEGGNGSGKSSLLKLLAGADIAHTGTVTMGSGVVLSCVPQDAGFLRGDLREFAKQRQIDETLFKTILRKMGLERAQFEKGMEELSAGQKKKVLLAASLCQRAHLYLWDEPLNYLDIDCRRQIETLIREFAPTMVFVEHDGAFREAVATRTVKVERG